MSFLDLALGVSVWVIVALILAKVKGPGGLALAWVAGLGFAAVIAVAAPRLGIATEMTMAHDMLTAGGAALVATLVAVFVGPRAK